MKRREALGVAALAIAVILATPSDAFTVAIPAPIYLIQGDGLASPMPGQEVTTTGVVTVILGSGFFMQDPLGDGIRPLRTASSCSRDPARSCDPSRPATGSR